MKTFEYGKLQPQAKEIEQAVLGAILMDNKVLPVVMSILDPSDFYLESHQSIYTAILALVADFTPVDILTVTEALKKAGKLESAGGPYAIVSLSNRVGSAANCEYHARIIQQKAISRKLIAKASQAIRDAYDETNDVFDLVDALDHSIREIRANISDTAAPITPEQVRRETLDEIRRARDPDFADENPFVQTRIYELSKRAPFGKGDLVILAARPGMGKTALLLQLARDHCDLSGGETVLLFSLEMMATQLYRRNAAADAQVDGKKLRDARNLSDAEFQRLEKVIETDNRDIHIDASYCTITDIEAKSRFLATIKKIGFIGVDYIQIIKSQDKKFGNREQEVSSWSNRLKQLAKEIGVPVICLAQLSRSVEQRGGDKRPMLSDLRESGAIEQDADSVIFIYRPEYYDILTDADGNSLKGVAKFIVAKNRHGEPGDVTARWIPEYQTFTNWAPSLHNNYAHVQNPYESQSVIQSNVNTDNEEILF